VPDMRSSSMGSGPSCHGRRSLLRAALCQLLQREPASNVPTTSHLRFVICCGLRTSCGTKILACGCQVSPTQGAAAWPATRTCKNCFTRPSRTSILRTKKILSALPKMAKVAQSEKLKARLRSTRPKNTSLGLRRYLKRSMKRLVAKPLSDHGDHRGRSGRDEGVQRRVRLGRWSPRGSLGGRAL